MAGLNAVPEPWIVIITPCARPTREDAAWRAISDDKPVEKSSG
jgi:hypothetical protein